MTKSLSSSMMPAQESLTTKTNFKFIDNIFCFEFLYICVLFGVPVDNLPVIGAYSFYSNIFFGLLATIVGFIIFQRNKWLVKKFSLNIFLLHIVFAMYAIFSLFQVSDPYHIGFRKVILILLGGSWTIIGAIIIGESKERLERFVFSLFFFGMFFVVVNLLLFPLNPLSSSSRTVFTENYQHASRAAGLAIISGSVLLVFADIKIIKKGMIIIAIFLAIIAQMSSGGRTGVLASFLCLLLLAFFYYKSNISLKKILYLICLLGFLYFFISYAVSQNWTPASVNRFLVILEGDSETNISYTNRLGRYLTAADFFSAAPVFGHGTGSWDEISGEIDSFYPHNIFLELFVEQGILGTLIFLFPVTLCLIRAYKSQKMHDNYVRTLLILFFFYVLVTVMITGDLGLNLYFYACYTLLGTSAVTLKSINASLYE